MPPRLIRLLISTIIVVHLLIVTAAMLGHRRVSYLHDDVLTAVAPYTAIGNWRVDTNCIPIANASQLGEIVCIEWHERDTPADDAWKNLHETNLFSRTGKSLALAREQRFEQKWLHQLSQLLLYDNDEGAGQMLMAVLPKRDSLNATKLDKVRVTVAPRLSLEQYVELEADDDPSKIPIAYQPQVAYVASIIDLGTGKLSLLRQMEAGRASKAIEPTSRSAAGKGLRP